MNKSNAITFLSLCGVILLTLIFMIGAHHSAQKDNPANGSTEENTASQTTGTATAPSEKEEASSEGETERTPQPVDKSKTLFIGDSRTVGLMEYGKITEADFFCNTGMSVYNIQKEEVSMPNMGRVTLSQLLQNKKYDTIFIMLGINELGYQFDGIVKKYDELVKFVEANEPQAKIVILANLHVTKKRSDGDKYFNNNAINRLNTEISKFANGKNIFYLDGNSLFDDETGALSADKSSDNAHLLGKYYVTWGEWILEQTALL